MTTTTTRPAAPAAEASRLRMPARALVIVLFATYLALLVWIVLWKGGTPWIGEAQDRVIKLVPFADTSEFGASAPREVLANIAFFVPFGVYLGLLAPGWRWWRVTAISAALSLALEALQYVLAIGSTDSTDVIANAAGGLAGLGLLALARGRFGARASAVVVRLCALGTAIALIACLMIIASRRDGGPPGDRPGGGPAPTQATSQARLVPNASPSR
ncbi:VanZ family protein [Agromyces lapidis]|uniref:VanZ family protein n=1 Tax=Agromyces lapidis TaxID=279574 RepID=A0ABV5SU20_9MICO|nr:VanZ family protein [Agromyces lapidis]